MTTAMATNCPAKSAATQQPVEVGAHFKSSGNDFEMRFIKAFHDVDDLPAPVPKINRTFTYASQQRSRQKRRAPLPPGPRVKAGVYSYSVTNLGDLGPILAQSATLPRRSPNYSNVPVTIRVKPPNKEKRKKLKSFKSAPTLNSVFRSNNPSSLELKDRSAFRTAIKRKHHSLRHPLQGGQLSLQSRQSSTLRKWDKKGYVALQNSNTDMESICVDSKNEEYQKYSGLQRFENVGSSHSPHGYTEKAVSFVQIDSIANKNFSPVHCQNLSHAHNIHNWSSSPHFTSSSPVAKNICPGGKYCVNVSPELNHFSNFQEVTDSNTSHTKGVSNHSSVSLQDKDFNFNTYDTLGCLPRASDNNSQRLSSVSQVPKRPSGDPSRLPASPSRNPASPSCIPGSPSRIPGSPVSVSNSPPCVVLDNSSGMHGSSSCTFQKVHPLHECPSHSLSSSSAAVDFHEFDQNIVAGGQLSVNANDHDKFQYSKFSPQWVDNFLRRISGEYGNCLSSKSQISRSISEESEVDRIDSIQYDTKLPIKDKGHNNVFEIDLCTPDKHGHTSVSENHHSSFDDCATNSEITKKKIPPKKPPRNKKNEMYRSDPATDHPCPLPTTTCLKALDETSVSEKKSKDISGALSTQHSITSTDGESIPVTKKLEQYYFNNSPKSIELQPYTSTTPKLAEKTPRRPSLTVVPPGSHTLKKNKLFRRPKALPKTFKFSLKTSFGNFKFSGRKYFPDTRCFRVRRPQNSLKTTLLPARSAQPKRSPTPRGFNNFRIPRVVIDCEPEGLDDENSPNRLTTNAIVHTQDVSYSSINPGLEESKSIENELDNSALDSPEKFYTPRSSINSIDFFDDDIIYLGLFANSSEIDSSRRRSLFQSPEKRVTFTSPNSVSLFARHKSESSTCESLNSPYLVTENGYSPKKALKNGSHISSKDQNFLAEDASARPAKYFSTYEDLLNLIDG